MARNRLIAAVAVLILAPALAGAEVARVEVTSRRDVVGGRAFGPAGSYELVAGRVHFVVDPEHPRNTVVADLDKAPRNAAGLVELSADLSILKPKDAARGNGVALIDIVNRGRRTVLTGFNRATAAGDLTAEADFGDGLLMRQGFTIVWVGWEFDVPKRDGVIRIDVPPAAGVTGVVRASFTPDARRPEFTVGDLSGYSPSNPAAAGNSLTVRDGFQGTPSTIPHDRWQLAGNVVTLEGGFEPGRIYELAYAAANPPVAGLGFVAVRDTAAWLKHAADAVAPAKYVYAFGSSQSGRFLRNFLYEGFNTDERNRQVLDAVMAHIAGAARIDINRRWATPTALGQFTATSFPFADSKQRDPVTGKEDGALDNPRARDHQPKIFYTNTGVEYWGGGRSAALIHTTPDGTRDVALPDNERVYFLAGSQHGPARFPSAISSGQQRDNPTDYWLAMRGLLVAMDKWVRDRVAPPPSRQPRLQDGTLVRAADVAFPSVPTVRSPRGLAAGVRGLNPLAAQDGGAGAALPLLVPQVDQDGNERAGIRLPDVAVPLATYTGWNFRKPAIGGSDQLFPLLGSYVAFPATRADRESTHDPRPAIDERYPTREQYLTLVQEAGTALVKDRYLLTDDLPAIVKHAGEHWDLLTRKAGTATR
ncbi:MAG: alpha/beta hydrolase domain-containing protein [Acidobacteriota bacterium]